MAHHGDLVEINDGAPPATSSTAPRPHGASAIAPKPRRTGILGLYDKIVDWCWNNAWMTRIKQQKLHAWTPIPTPCPIISCLFFLSLVSFAIGVIWVSFTYGVVVESKTFRYDNVCAIGSKCTFRFRLDEDMTQPVYLYYRLENYYQNHRRYMRSRSDSQLRGDVSVNDYSSVQSDCDPLTSENDSHDSSAVYLPCGLVAKSYFNDSLVMRFDDNSRVQQTTNDVAWSTDIDHLFKNPPANTPGKRVVDSFTDPDFVVWMRSAALPNFNKLYRVITQDLKKGVYRMEIQNRYPVQDFGGKKFFHLTTTTWLGGANHFLGWAYIIIGSVMFIFAVLFLIKQIVRPRKLGDPSYLEWNRPPERHQEMK